MSNRTLTAIVIIAIVGFFVYLGFRYIPELIEIVKAYFEIV